MKLNKTINVLNMIIATLCLVAAILIFLIIKDVLHIKKENAYLKHEIHKLEKQKKETENNNVSLKEKISQFQEPNTSNLDIPDGWKLYRYLDYGFEVAYPSGYKVNINSQESSNLDSGIEARISIHNGDPIEWVDINMISLQSYSNINDYIKRKFNYKIYVKESLYINDKKHDVYKLSGKKHYYIFLKSKNYIFDINSTSQEFLLKILQTFKFI